MDKDALFLVLLLAAIGFLLISQPGTPKGEGGVLLEPRFKNEEFQSFPSQIATQQDTTNASDPPEEPPEEIDIRLPHESIYKDKVFLRKSRAGESDPKKEYIELQTSRNNQKSIPITNWVIKNSRNEEFKIGEGAYLAYSAQINPTRDILLAPGGKAYIATGRSPIGTSFLINSCMGYFEQFQDFTPSISKSCPSAYNNIPFDDIPP